MTPAEEYDLEYKAAQAIAADQIWQMMIQGNGPYVAVVIKRFRDLLRVSTDARRLEILEDVTDRMCVHCGSWGSKTCYCTRDD